MKRYLLTSLVVMLLIFGAFAQGNKSVHTGEQTITLTGAVYDINGAVIINGTSIVANDTVGGVYEAGTDEEGIYKLTLPLRSYSIKVSAPGFCPAQIDRFRVVKSTHGKMSLDFVLEVADEQERCKHEIIDRKSKRKTDKQSKPFIE